MLKRLGLMLVMALAMISGARGGNSVSYKYDNAGRLTGATYCAGIAAAYTLDAAGNRITVNTTGNGVLPAEDPNGLPDVVSFTAGGVQILAGQTLQIEVDRLCPSTTALTATYSLSGTAPTSDYSVSGSLNWAAGDGSSKYLTVVFTSTPGTSPETVWITLQVSSAGALGGNPSYEVSYGIPANTQPVNCSTNPTSCS